jgi:hypothetical protein
MCGVGNNLKESTQMKLAILTSTVILLSSSYAFAGVPVTEGS